MGLNRFSRFLAFATYLLIIAGGLVTSTGSGLSVPDWPLSYGSFFPPMVGGIRFEHSHRLIAGSVGLLTLVLMVAILRAEKRVWLKKLGMLTFGAVILQAVLGGITVIYLLPTFVSVFHACLAQTFFCLIISIALFTSPLWTKAEPVQFPKSFWIHRILFVTTALIYLQLILGAVVRHTAGNGIVYHALMAFLVLTGIFLSTYSVMCLPAGNELQRPAIFLGLLAVAQLFLGVGSWMTRIMMGESARQGVSAVLFATAHQATGALILASCVYLTLLSLRLFIQPESGHVSIVSGGADRI